MLAILETSDEERNDYYEPLDYECVEQCPANYLLYKEKNICMRNLDRFIKLYCESSGENKSDKVCSSFLYICIIVILVLVIVCLVACIIVLRNKHDEEKRRWQKEKIELQNANQTNVCLNIDQRQNVRID